MIETLYKINSYNTCIRVLKKEIKLLYTNSNLKYGSRRWCKRMNRLQKFLDEAYEEEGKRLIEEIKPWDAVIKFDDDSFYEIVINYDGTEYTVDEIIHAINIMQSNTVA